MSDMSKEDSIVLFFVYWRLQGMAIFIQIGLTDRHIFVG